MDKTLKLIQSATGDVCPSLNCLLEHAGEREWGREGGCKNNDLIYVDLPAWTKPIPNLGSLCVPDKYQSYTYEKIQQGNLLGWWDWVLE